MKTDSVSNTYKEFNEDAFGVTNHGVWVMDGASALNKTCVTGEFNDVVYMVNYWTSYLNEHLDQRDKTIFEIFEQGIQDLNHQFSKFTPVEELTKLDRASASMGLIRVMGDWLECFVLGDIEISLRFKNGSIELVTDSAIEALDNQVTALMLANENREKELVFKDFTQEELDLLRHNRMKMNEVGGYAILEHDVKAVRRGIYKTYKMSDLEDALLMSDGYSAMHNKYNQFTLSELMDQSRDRGVESVVETLRVIESEDLEMRKFKRLKKNDDSTGVYVCF